MWYLIYAKNLDTKHIISNKDVLKEDFKNHFFVFSYFIHSKKEYLYTVPKIYHTEGYRNVWIVQFLDPGLLFWSLYHICNCICKISGLKFFSFLFGYQGI